MQKFYVDEHGKFIGSFYNSLPNVSSYSEVPSAPDTINQYWNGNGWENTPPTAEQNKEKAEKLLKESDWVEAPSVSNLAITPHLTNASEFVSWRASVRAIAVHPVAGNLVWPVKPTNVWSS
jgi:hypothetical protein